MQTYQRARNVCRLNSQISQTALLFITRFFVLNIPLFTLLTFSYRNFFPLFVCFEILWQLATTHATGTQIVHAKMTSLDAIFVGETGRALTLSRAFAAEDIKIYRSHFALVKKFELDL